MVGIRGKCLGSAWDSTAGYGGQDRSGISLQRERSPRCAAQEGQPVPGWVSLVADVRAPHRGTGNHAEAISIPLPGIHADASEHHEFHQGGCRARRLQTGHLRDCISENALSRFWAVNFGPMPSSFEWGPGRFFRGSRSRDPHLLDRSLFSAAGTLSLRAVDRAERLTCADRYRTSSTPPWSRA